MSIPPAPQELHDELARLLASRLFASSRRSRQLLEYVVNQMTLGTAHKLKEYTLGVDVFERGPSFDPKLDTIVRTEFWRLRKRLATYYETEGAANPLRITFRKRSFEPTVKYRAGAPTRTEQSSHSRPATLTRVAVLPFISIDGKHETFADGLTTDLIAELGTLPGLNVVSRTSSFQFKAQHRDVREIAEQLGAQIVVEGSVQCQGRDLHVVVLLTDAVTGAHFFSRTYDRKTPLSLPLQRTLSQGITTDIDVALTARTCELVAGAASGASAEYLDWLMRSRFRFKYRRGAAREVAKSLAYFQSASLSRPDDPSIRRGLLVSLGTFLCIEPAAMPEMLPRLVAGGGSSGGSGLLDARIGAGMVAMFNGKYALAADMLECAVALDPFSSNAHTALGIFWLHAGRLEEALREMRAGQRLDPTSAFKASMVALTQFNLRRFDEASSQAARSLALDPHGMLSHMLLADIELLTGTYDATVKKLFEICRMSDPHPLVLGRLAYAHGMNGRGAEVQTVLNHLLPQGDEPGHIAPAIALAYTGLGDRKSALNWLEVAARQNSIVDLIPRSFPLFDSLRSEPRFSALIPRLD